MAWLRRNTRKDFRMQRIISQLERAYQQEINQQKKCDKFICDNTPAPHSLPAHRPFFYVDRNNCSMLVKQRKDGRWNATYRYPRSGSGCFEISMNGYDDMREAFKWLANHALTN